MDSFNTDSGKSQRQIIRNRSHAGRPYHITLPPIDQMHMQGPRSAHPRYPPPRHSFTYPPLSDTGVERSPSFPPLTTAEEQSSMRLPSLECLLSNPIPAFEILPPYKDSRTARHNPNPYSLSPTLKGDPAPYPKLEASLPPISLPQSRNTPTLISYSTNMKPFECDLCPQRFGRSHDLKRHYKIHLNEKPYQCEICDTKFTRLDALKRHQRTKKCMSRLNNQPRQDASPSPNTTQD
ncbi:hypothetical protein CONCODRAFT_80763 [Conidiobolus coronatus NRRL 28638]|uniref:C2H2-type domain-containing protein n=1 Tax=Conidiobolus coronatus (strain ATCC 28846 / CBS 209.66 / NRRL 28638) TaxID=796925 RepID=A0A137NRU7_CONC2|nr:hypothetical protein CONCODRAFT_80763 [Conidiobolus coronatus NRRL 28638]|eukprot:KXN65467.1 hypothetical protein CONCODRAFT_80763 [Conidiobolus coronatus NRRL 28638]